MIAFFTTIAQAQIPVLDLELGQAGTVCNPETCVDIYANYTKTHETTSYTVAPIMFQNLYPFTGGTLLNNSNDDVWSPQLTLPFSFCFYGQSYNSLLIGSNGLITFDVASFQPLVIGNCPWSFSGTVPSTTFPVKNAIYGVFQDTDIQSSAVANPGTQNINYYIGGTMPNRYLVVNFNELPAFNCNSNAMLQTSQVILHESTNIIDIYIKKRQACTAWQYGVGVVGIQNAAGTQATVPPGRNTGAWNTTFEAWRFTPNGAVTSSLAWMASDGSFLSNADVLNICPQQSGSVTAVLTYQAACGNDPIVMTAINHYQVYNGLGSGTPSDLYACSESGSSTFNLTVNDFILSGDPANFEILYYPTLEAAQNNDNSYFPNPQSFTGTDGQAVYMRVYDITSGTVCADIRQFTLHVTMPSGAPAGTTVQYFTAGQTLASLVVTGQNIQWFATATGGSPLALTTILVSDTTYYAEQANAYVCDEPLRSSQATPRFAVTAYDIALGTQAFAEIKVSVTPNPVNNLLTVESAQAIKALSVYTIQGQLVATSKENKLQSVVDFSGFANGIYLLRVQTLQGTKDLKIVKQ